MSDTALIPQARPVLKWAGGKTQLLPEILPRLPKSYRGYHEPFIGSGAVFFTLAPVSGSIADTNRHLIHLYLDIQLKTAELSRELELLQAEFNSAAAERKKEFYLERRAEFNHKQDASVRQSALMVFLNKTGFNGMYRENAKGKFNIPFSGRDSVTLPAAEHLEACRQVLTRTAVLHTSFDSIIERAEAGDLVYFDPPYIPVSNTSSFTAYQAGGFGHEHQSQLASVVQELDGRGVNVLLSNSDTPTTRSLYGDLRIDQVFARRSINSKATGRGSVSELLIRNY